MPCTLFKPQLHVLALILLPFTQKTHPFGTTNCNPIALTLPKWHLLWQVTNGIEIVEEAIRKIEALGLFSISTDKIKAICSKHENNVILLTERQKPKNDIEEYANQNYPLSG